ncbi:hypothetical protein PMAYCL1PPCAC_20822, partial [Pristionchus mayeri]
MDSFGFEIDHPSASHSSDDISITISPSRVNSSGLLTNSVGILCKLRFRAVREVKITPPTRQEPHQVILEHGTKKISAEPMEIKGVFSEVWKPGEFPFSDYFKQEGPIADV